MELVLALATRQLGQLTRVLVNHAVAHITLLNSLELPIQIPFPQQQTIGNRSVLMGQENRQLHHQNASLQSAANLLAAVHLDGAERMVDGQRDDQLHASLIDHVGGQDFARRCMNGNLHVFVFLLLVNERPQFVLAQLRRHVAGGDLVDERLLTRSRVVPPFACGRRQMAQRTQVDVARQSFGGNIVGWKRV